MKIFTNKKRVSMILGFRTLELGVQTKKKRKKNYKFKVDGQKPPLRLIHNRFLIKISRLKLSIT